MPKKRKDQSLEWLPPRVYEHRGKWSFCPPAGGRIALCPVDSPKLLVLKRYEEEKGNLERGVTFKNIIRDYVNSHDHTKKSKDGKKEELRYIDDWIMPAFGRMRPLKIEPSHVKRLMRAISDHIKKQESNKGNEVKPNTGNPSANRCRSTMQAICTYAYEEGKLKTNPCAGLRRLPEDSRERYVLHNEYRAIYKHATPLLKVAMELAYNCFARIGDIVELKRADLMESGIFIAQGKTNKKQIKKWTDRLRTAIAQASQLQTKGNVTSLYVLVKADGSRVSKRGLQAQYTKAKSLACEELGFNSVEEMDITFHDLKAKGMTDFEGTEQEAFNASGNTKASGQVYLRKAKVVESLNNPAPLD